MFGLDQYANDVILAYLFGIGILAFIILSSLAQSKRAKRKLEELEK